jgi:hypothetical protein
MNIIQTSVHAEISISTVRVVHVFTQEVVLLTSCISRNWNEGEYMSQIVQTKQKQNKYSILFLIKQIKKEDTVHMLEHCLNPTMTVDLLTNMLLIRISYENQK